MKNEQIAFLDVAKKCRRCRTKKDIAPKGFFTCSKCGYNFYAE